MFAEGREDTIVGMKQLHEMAYELRAAIEAVDVRSLGGLLREAYESKKRMNPRIAEGTPIERLLEVAHDAGASGGKICGAGGGGYLLLACEPARQPAVRAALEANGGRVTDFAFRPHGVEATVQGRPWRPS
jgi:D-glycero-alpha-D-manno-heptose-7-phosphate kinase